MKNTFRRLALLGIALVVGVIAFASFTPDAAADNDQITVFSLAARTANANSGHATYGHTNNTHRGVKLHVDIDSVTGTGTIDCKVQGRDPVSGTWVDITGASTGADTAGATELTIYPGIAETANVSVSDVIPRSWRVVATVVTGGTFSVGASYID
jgi:hypothetical protein